MTWFAQHFILHKWMQYIIFTSILKFLTQITNHKLVKCGEIGSKIHRLEILSFFAFSVIARPLSRNYCKSLAAYVNIFKTLLYCSIRCFFPRIDVPKFKCILFCIYHELAFLVAHKIFNVYLIPIQICQLWRDMLFVTFWWTFPNSTSGYSPIN